MPNLKDLRTRIKSVNNTQQITKAMKLVSAAKFGRAQNNVVQGRPYASYLEELVTILYQTAQRAGKSHPLLAPAESSKHLIMVISSERGLCGGYNGNIAKKAIRTVEETQQKNQQPVILCLGKKAFQIFVRRLPPSKFKSIQISEAEFTERKAEVLSNYQLILITDTFDKPSYERAVRLANTCATSFQDAQIGHWSLVYSRFQSAVTQLPSTQKMLPFELNANTKTTSLEPLCEPNLEKVLEITLSRYFAASIYKAFLEAIASEHGARMSAMDSATRNAKEMVKKLQIQYQRARQAAITKELIEIISGAEAL